MTATLIAAAIVGVATLGGTMAGNQATVAKTDRFAVVGDELCKGQAWPNLTPECLSWKEGEVTAGKVRFVTFSETDEETMTTTLTRTRENAIN